MLKGKILKQSSNNIKLNVSYSAVVFINSWNTYRCDTKAHRVDAPDFLPYSMVHSNPE